MMKLTQSRVKALLVFCAVFPIGFLGIQTKVSGQVYKPGCYFIGGYRYVGGRSGSTYGHTNDSTYRWDPFYTQYCPSSNPQPVSIPGSVPNTSPPVGKFRDGQPYVSKNYFYGAYSETPDGKPLDIRSGPGTNYPIVDRVPNGVFLSMTGAMKQDSTGGSWTELYTKTWVYTKHTR